AEGPTDTEVAAAITNIAGSYATRFETASDFANALLAAELHDLDAGYVSDFPLAVAGVDRESATAAAQRVLDPSDVVLVIVGDAKQVGPQLKAAGWKYETVAFTEPISD